MSRVPWPPALIASRCSGFGLRQQRALGRRCRRRAPRAGGTAAAEVNANGGRWGRGAWVRSGLPGLALGPSERTGGAPKPWRESGKGVRRGAGGRWAQTGARGEGQPRAAIPQTPPPGFRSHRLPISACRARAWECLVSVARLWANRLPKPSSSHLNCLTLGTET